MKKLLLIIIFIMASVFAFADSIKIYYQDGTSEVIELKKTAIKAELMSYAYETGVVNIDREYYLAGEMMAVTYAVNEPVQENGWLGIIPENVPAGSEAVNDQHDVTYIYLKKNMNGSIQLKIPENTPRGRYVLRVFDTDSNGKQLAESKVFDIQ